MGTHIKIFVRSLLRDKVHSTINLLGLSLGLLAFIIIQLYVVWEKSYDKFYQNAEHVYRVHSRKTQGGQPQPWKSSTSVNLTRYLIENYDQVTEATRVHKFDQNRILLQVDDKQGQRQVFDNHKGYHADGTYFNVFPQEMITGNARDCLVEPYSIVLTQNLAMVLYGSVDVVGKTLTLVDNESHEMKVTAVVEDPPKNTHLTYDYLVSLSTFQSQHPDWNWLDAWYWDYFHSYIVLDPLTDQEAFEETFATHISSLGLEQFERMNFSMEFTMMPLRDIHLNSNLNNEFENNGSGSTVRLLNWISYFILLIAWVNYVNLTTAKSINRGKEIGIKKTMGASRISLIFQLILESFAFNLLSLFIALSMLLSAAPWMSGLLGTEVFQAEGLSANRLIGLVAIFLAGTLLSAVYPALLMSQLGIVQGAKSAFKSSKEGLLIRKGLVVFQFAVTSIMMVGAYVIYEQMSYLLNRDMGFEPEQILVINEPNEADDYNTTFRSFKQTLSANPRIEAVSAVGSLPGIYNNSLERFKLVHQANEQAQPMKFHVVDYDFEKVFGLNLLAGRAFVEGREQEDNRVAIMNETAIRLLGFDDPMEAVGSNMIHLTYSNREIAVRLIGVVNDYHHSPMETPDAMIFMLGEQTYWASTHYMCLNVKTEGVSNTLDFIQTTYDTFFTGDKFNYWFLDKSYNEAYTSHLAFQKVFSLFSLLGILIANLGLIGLSIFTINQAKKELSIRKVLGAGFNRLYQHFSFQFLKLVLLGAVLGLPASYWLFSQWLNNYTSRIDLGINFFGLPLLLILLLALAIITSTIVKAIQTNPVKNLRAE